MLRLAVLGATGRMGQSLVRLIGDADDLQLAGAATEPAHPALGQDAGTVAGVDEAGVLLTHDVADAVAGCDVAVDFTLPAAVRGNLAACVDAGVPLVMGTTGLGDDEQAALADAARKIALVYARNMSVGVSLLTELVRIAAGTLGAEYDIEISEAHHRHKVDAPSGTALQLGDAAAEARGGELATLAVFERHGRTGERPEGAIGFAAVRAGSIVGDHQVMFAGDEEIIQLGHRAVDRDLFARGALRAARWVTGRSPGLYSMRDVLNLGGKLL